MRSLIVIATLIATPAYAIDFSKTIVDDSGKQLCSIEIKEGVECPEGKGLTLRIAARNALRFSFPDERDVSGDEKYKREELGQGLIGANDVKLKVEDIALIKKLIAKLYGPIVVYQAWNMLEGKDK